MEQKNGVVRGEHDYYPDDEIDLAELFLVLWRKKIIIGLSTGLFCCLVFLLAMPKLFTPAVTIVSQQFSLKFKGVDENKYPNGLRFSLAEFTSPYIIETVFRQNKLAEFGLDVQDLRDSLVVKKAVAGLSFLESKYQDLLAQKNLTPEERQRIQDEYQEQRRKLLGSPYYSISWVGGRDLPSSVQEKVLLDILTLWAKSAEEQKGVYLYQVPVLNEDAFYFENEDEEYIVKVDMLRRVVQEVKSNLAEIEKLPGALLVETSSGVNLTALQVRVNDLLQHRITPLIGLIRNGGLHVNQELSLIYTQEQLYNLELKKGLLQGEMGLLSDALDGYINSNDQLIARRQSDIRGGSGDVQNRATVIPQIGDRFLDQLVALANDNQDVAYRQDITTKMVEVGNKLLLVEKDITYYQQLLKSRSEGSSKKYDALMSEFKTKNLWAFAEARKLTREMNELYQLLSSSYLKITENLYALEGPAQHDLGRSFSIKKIALVCGAAVFVFFCMVCFAVMLTSAVTRKNNG